MDRILIILKKENGPRASSAPALGLNTIIFKHVYWYMQQTQVSVYRTIGPLVSYAIFWGLLLISLENKELMDLGTNVLYCDFGSYGGTSSNGINVSTLDNANLGSVSIFLFLNGLI